MRKENVKKCKKVFTKNETNNIINTDYNPLKANKCEREGLLMEEKDIILKKLLENLSIEEVKFIEKYQDECIKIYRKGMKDCFNYYNKDGTF